MRREVSLVASLDAVEHVVDSRRHRDHGKLSREKLLQGLPRRFSATDERLVDIVGDIADLNVRHACILHADADDAIRLAAHAHVGAVFSLPQNAGLGLVRWVAEVAPGPR